MWLALIKQAAETAQSAEAPWYGYPPWVVVLVGTVIAAAGLWIFSKLLKWVLLVAIAVVLAGGLIWAVRLYLGST